MWRDISNLAFVFGSGTFLLLSCSYRKSLISACYQQFPIWVLSSSSSPILEGELWNLMEERRGALLGKMRPFRLWDLCFLASMSYWSRSRLFLKRPGALHLHRSRAPQTPTTSSFPSNPLRLHPPQKHAEPHVFRPSAWPAHSPTTIQRPWLASQPHKAHARAFSFPFLRFSPPSLCIINACVYF